jgi:hypothetical protein
MYYDYYFYLNTFVNLNHSINNYNFNFFFLKNFKNFFNAITYLLKFDFKFLSFDINEKNFFFKNLFFSDVELLSYNFFFKNFLNVLKKQTTLHFYKSTFKKNKIKFIIIVDYEYYYNFLSYFNLLRISIFSLIPHTHSNFYSDFFLLFNKSYAIFYKTICYSYILYIYNMVCNDKKKSLQLFFLKNIKYLNN